MDSFAIEKQSYFSHPHPLYAQELKKLFDLSLFGERLDLQNPYRLNALLQNPLSCFKSIIIGGTNGKGSTCAYIEALAKSANLKVGLFTSPHLISFRERIKVDGNMIPQGKVVEGLKYLFKLTEKEEIHQTFFEMTWALALWYFREEKVDYVIWEVGLGGRLDATNACEPVISAVVSVGLDHCQILGNTLEEIAREKVGIFRKNIPCLTCDTGDGLKAILSQSPYPVIEVKALEEIKNLEILAGEHQQRNASLAWTIAQSLGWPTTINALTQVNWPARIEKINDFYIDCTHNPHGAQALAQWIKQHDTHQKIFLIFGAVQGKDIEQILRILAPFVTEIIFTTPQYPRRVSAQELHQKYGDLFQISHVIDSVSQAIVFLQNQRDQGKISNQDITLIAGSCYLAGESRAYFLDIPFPEEGIISTAR